MGDASSKAVEGAGKSFKKVGENLEKSADEKQ